MNFNENDLLRNETELLNLMLSKQPSAKVLIKLEFDTEDQVLFFFAFIAMIRFFLCMGKAMSVHIGNFCCRLFTFIAII